jgi:hypothetical protein
VDHLLLLVWHAALVSVFFAFLWRNTAHGRRALLVKTFLIMTLGGGFLGWLMYPFP